MKTPTKIVSVLAFSLLFQACSSPRDREVPADVEQLDGDERFEQDVERLSEEERGLLEGYLARARAAQALGQPLPGTTIGKAIEAQRALVAELARREAAETQQAAEEAEAAEKAQAEQTALAAKAAEEHEAALAAMNAALTVAITDLDFVASNYRQGRYSDSFSIVIALRNNTDKDMSGIKGTVVFQDMFGDDIKQVGLSVDDGIEAGQSIRWVGSLDYNQFRDEDMKLRNTPLEKMKISWAPDIYLFADGSSMQMEG